MSAVTARVAAGPARWWLFVVPIAAWIAHLAFSAAFVAYSCTAPEWRWILYAATPASALPVLAAMWIAWNLYRGADLGGVPADEVDDVHFLGWIALLVGIANLVLIVAEGIVVPFISSCA